MTTPEEKKARLAKALRENLRRRKAQVRAALDDAPPEPDASPAPDREGF